MNICVFNGNLTRDFEYRVNGEYSVARCSLALNRGKDKNGQDKGADFVNVVAFGKTAETLDKYGKKGKKMSFVCHVKTDSYEKEGKKVYTTDFVIDRFEFCDSLGAGNKTTSETNEADGFLPIPEGNYEDLPFA